MRALVEALRQTGSWLALRLKHENDPAGHEFDERHGVRTAGWTLAYEPVPPAVLQEVLESVPSTGLFVDLGCGKGRALVGAVTAGWPRAVGVEVESGLHAIALENARQLGGGRITALWQDAAAFVWPPEPLTIFLFNPFEADLLAEVLDRLEASLHATPRSATVLYVNPAHRDVLEGRGWQITRSGGEPPLHWLVLVPPVALSAL